MAYQLRLYRGIDGPIVKAVKYFPPGPFTRRSSNGMKRWMSRQLECDKEAIELPGISFVQWLRLIKHKSLTVDKL